MPSIKIQKRVVLEGGEIKKSGSASIIDTFYDPQYSGRSKKKSRESLGSIIWLSPNQRSGIFNSKTRGIVFYTAEEDQFYEVDKDDPRIKDIDWYKELRIHTTFGDVYLLLSYIQESGILEVLRKTFQNEKLYQKILAHITYGIIEKEDKGHCDDFITQSFMSYILDQIPVGSLGSDTPYYDILGDDIYKINFFKNFISKMRETNPDFGRACYVDSTPLPNDIKNNPYTYLSSHGTGETCPQTRLAVILDSETGMPVWYQIVPGNKLDLSTINNIETDLDISLAVKLESLVLDAGYALQELFNKYNIQTYIKSLDGKDSHYLIVRMPNKKGYPYMELYEKVKNLISSPKFQIFREDHTYFTFKSRETFLGVDEYCYVYVDKDNALRHQREWIRKHQVEYEKMSLAEKEFNSVEYGYFVLISNKDSTPEIILDEYFGRTDIEVFFKSAKEYLNILPIAKWNKSRVHGKIFSDAIRCIVFQSFRRASISCNRDLFKMLRQTQSLNCILKGKEEVLIDTPNKNVREYFESFGYIVPAHIILQDYKEQIRSGKTMVSSPIKKKKRGRKPKAQTNPGS